MVDRMLAKYFKDESGATAIEYGLIAGLIAVALIAGATAIGNSLDSIFQNAATEIESTSDF